MPTKTTTGHTTYTTNKPMMSAKQLQQHPINNHKPKERTTIVKKIKETFRGKSKPPPLGPKPNSVHTQECHIKNAEYYNRMFFKTIELIDHNYVNKLCLERNKMIQKYKNELQQVKAKIQQPQYRFNNHEKKESRRYRRAAHRSDSFYYQRM